MEQPRERSGDQKVRYIYAVVRSHVLGLDGNFSFLNADLIGLINFQTLRRLAQNREAARKSRLRKKVCIFSHLLCSFHNFGNLFL